jgi:hypothetical protein
VYISSVLFIRNGRMHALLTAAIVWQKTTTFANYWRKTIFACLNMVHFIIQMYFFSWWFWGLMLYHLNHAASPLALGYFSNMISLFARDNLKPHSSYLFLLHSWDYRYEATYPVCILRWGFVNYFAPGWPWTMIFLISSSQVAGITMYIS